MLEIEQARKILLADIKHSGKTQKRPLKDSLGMFLANDIISIMDVPPADNSAMDGYAVNHKDLTNAPCVLPVSLRICAGSAPPEAITPNTAARIYTGAQIPENCDAVIMQENTERQANGDILIHHPIKAGQNIRSQGQDIAKGSTILKKHHKLTPQDIGLLASIGVSNVDVFSPINVALIGTGNELKEPGTPLQPGQIYNSNQPMLTAMLNEMNVNIVRNDWIEDNIYTTIQALKESSECADIIITSGGVSVGDEDHVKNAVKAIGTIELWKVNIKPGKPIAFGSIGTSTFIGLPGNPVSAFISFLLFAKPLIYTLQGGIYKAPPPFMVPSLFSMDTPQKRPEYLRVNLTHNGLEKYNNQSSGVLSSVCHCNALALIRADTTIEKNQAVECWPLSVL